MLFRQIKLIIFAIIFSSCSIMDLRPIGIRMIPDTAWSILPSSQSPIIISFDTAMDKSSIENILTIGSPSGIVNGDIQWEDNTLFFHPSSPWQPGIRYVLRFTGMIRAEDKREHPVSRELPFYVVSRTSLPYLISSIPENNASVYVWNDEILELYFSEPMDRSSTEEALRLDIPGDKIYEWFEDDTILMVSSDRPLNPWTVYSWSISEKATSREAAPLAREYSRRFITDLNREFINVLRVVPLFPPSLENDYRSELWDKWIMAGLSISGEQGLGSGHGIGIEFNKIPDYESLRRSIIFSPPLPGRVEILSPYSAVYIPSRDPEPETRYTMRISGTLRDNEGLRMGDDYLVSFISDIPYLNISSINTGLEFLPDPSYGNILRVRVNTGGIVQLFINFSLPIYPEHYIARRDNVFKVSLTPFFPGHLPSVSLRSASWLSSNTLELQWHGFNSLSVTEPQYYRLLIPGGIGGLENGRGSFLKEDIVIFLELI